MKNNKLLAIFAFLIAIATIYAEEKTATTDEKIEALSKEIEQLKTGKELFKSISNEKGKYGLGPAASKVYEVNQGVSIGGYGELVYFKTSAKKEDGTPKSASDIDKIDFLRAILYFGYKFNDNFVFNSEIEIEHANEIYLEFATIDYLMSPILNFRAGLLLVPMGLLNELHEPTTFLGSNRTYNERFIIPSTWRENGIGLFGSVAEFSYKLYLINSFRGKNFGLNDNGLREGRQKGVNALAENFGGVFRFDYNLANIAILGASAFYGATDQEQLEGANAMTFISEAHIDAKFKGISLRALISYANVEDAAKINLITPANQVGTDLLGYYVELGYDIFSLFNFGQNLILFGRYEKVELEKTAAFGLLPKPKNEREYLTLGIVYKPILHLAYKIDYEIQKNEAKTGLNRLNLAVGYIF